MSGQRHQALGLAAMAERAGVSQRPGNVGPKPEHSAPDTSWMADGACKGKDPALFQPIGESSHYSQQIEEARATCRGCAVIGICGEYALATRQSSGIWAAMTERDREMELRRRSRARQRSRAQS